MADCEQLDVYHLRDDDEYDLHVTTHSPGARQFTLIAVWPPRDWSLPSECRLSLDPGADPEGDEYSCSDAELSRSSGGTWTRLSPELQAAVEQAATETLPSTQSY